MMQANEEIDPRLKELLDEAYDSVMKEHGDDWNSFNEMGKYGRFVRKLPPGVDVDLDLALRYFSKREEKEKSAAQDIPNRDTEYGIVDTPYVAVFNELDVMTKYTESLLQWYSNESIRRRYTAPCIPIVQSSGTGKTKLLFEFKRKNRNIYEIVIISCLPKDERRQTLTLAGSRIHLYDNYLHFRGKENDTNFLQTYLDTLVHEQNQQKQLPLILIFDEAQELSRDSAIHMLQLRKFLRKKRRRQVVAFIAGTNHSLANCYPTQAQRTSSRKGEDEKNYHTSGSELYEPLFELYTMGCLANKITVSADRSEFEKAIPYGRPLFARLLLGKEPLPPNARGWPLQMKRSISDDEMAIAATRLLLNHTSPFETADTLTPFASVWATRVQLSGVSTTLVETLVAKGYAHLTRFQTVNMTNDSQSPPQPTVAFANLPDPVIARLAMCLMQEDWSLTGADRTVKGASKTSWVGKLKELFSSGLCKPSVGDLGEIISAAFLLFCGDVIRHKIDFTFSSFSVPVRAWYSILKDPSCRSCPDPVLGKGVPQVNFIQFCRNNLRYGLEDICKEPFLEYMYNCGCAAYAYECAPSIDAYAAIKCLDGAQGTVYAPLLISIKTRKRYTEAAAQKDIDTIVKSLYQCKQMRGLVIVVLLDNDDSWRGDELSDEEKEPKATPTLQKKRKSWQQVATASRNLAVDECCSDIVSRIVKIPANDPFNLTDVVRGATCKWEESTVFDSHCFAGITAANELRGQRKDTGTVKTLLSSTPESVLVEKLSVLWTERHKKLTNAEDGTGGNNDEAMSED